MDITKITRRNNDAGAPSGYSDSENHRDYFRICGGVEWPYMGRPGFLVLVGEQVRNLKSGAPAKFYGLAESQHRQNDDMLLKCVELSTIVDTWYSNIIPEAHRVALHQFNLGQEQKHLTSLQLTNVPMLSEAGDGAQLFRYTEAELDQRTSEGRKTVFLGECARVQAALQRVPEEWDSAKEILELPEVTALYYVLGAMFRLPYRIPSREPVFAMRDYDPLNPPWEKNGDD
ncbi:MAG: hypothetical protein ACLPUX_10960 [Syntrophobacteraceae bacterium]